MKFELNGVPEQVEVVLSVQELLVRFDLMGRRVAVAINTQVVPRSRFAEVQIADGDRVEVIHAVGGG